MFFEFLQNYLSSTVIVEAVEKLYDLGNTNWHGDTNLADAGKIHKWPRGRMRVGIVGHTSASSANSANSASSANS